MPPVGLWTQVAGRGRKRIKSANPPEKKVAVTSGRVHSGKKSCWSAAEVEDEVCDTVEDVEEDTFICLLCNGHEDAEEIASICQAEIESLLS